MREERPRLRPLKVAPDRLALRFSISVGPTGKVVFDGRFYSMKPDSIGTPGTLFLYRGHVFIIAGSFEANHARLVKPGSTSMLPEHRAQTVAAVSGKRGKRYLKRQHLLETGEAALTYLTEVLHRQPRTWVSEVERLHGLLQRHGPEPLRSAFDRAVTAQTFGAAYIEHYLHEQTGTMVSAESTM